MVVQRVYHCNNEILEWKWSSDNKLMPQPFWTSIFLIDGLLIDAGAPGGVEDLHKFVISLDSENMIEKCVITHNHEDHCGGGRMLQEEFNIPVFASKLAIPLLMKEKTYPDYRQMTWGVNFQPFQAELIKDSIDSKSGKYLFDVINTPGHAPEQISLIERKQQWAFITDAVMPKYQMIFGKDTDIPEDISLIYQSIKKLYELTMEMEDLLLFTSGKGVFKGRSFLKDRMDEINSLHLDAHRFHTEAKQQGLHGKQLLRYVLKEMYTRENFIGTLTRGGLSHKNLIISLLEWSIDY
ncbi:MAG: MBL fold metallo-hydrolase [Candidatus Lokiarchaeota archaeon]|nr:MBL fold metallo-hydrolase [Candidatus Lokiarchaeota archaeon]